MSGHAPKPWTWEWLERDTGWVNSGVAPVLKGADGKAVLDAMAFHEDATLKSEYPQDVAEANARLISAAPDLYEACRQIQSEISRNQNVPSLKTMQMIGDALAKADGKP